MNQIIKPMSLDDWYLLINRIYLYKNYDKSTYSIFAHLIEILGGLSSIISGKKKSNVKPENYLPKVITWWFALCGKVGIKSVEKIIWTKFPGVCPYCKKTPHKEGECKARKNTSKKIDWKELQNIGKDKETPKRLCDWQNMFDDIYPSISTTSAEKIFGRLCEEAGEMAEAIRLLPLTSRYFIVEACDLFAWIMAMINDFETKNGLLLEENRGLWIEEKLWENYPGKCLDCGSPICNCPPILETSLGRISKEIPSDEIEMIPGGLFRNFQEAKNLFALGKNYIETEKGNINITSEVLNEINNGINLILNHFNSENIYSNEITNDLSESLKLIKEFTSKQQNNEVLLKEIAQKISQLPEKEKSKFINFLKDTSSNVLVSGLLFIIKNYLE
ncbi:hypothetical protein CVT91_08650 [Candidatus Atribacteria bacterium HGW-Atribacteria-1]|nr:MAG: hypothetical protein CVT91_08650 [Candidatus Atribacteria bacterium HGW-Atribacteria-1]